MSVTQLFLLCLCASSLFASDTDKYVVNNFGKRNSVKYCGKNLVHALQIVCNGVYQHMFYKKSSPFRDNWRQLDYLDESPDHPFKLSGVDLITQVLRRSRRGITDECCRIGCNIAELSSYCGGYD